MLFSSPVFVLAFLPLTLAGFFYFGRNGARMLPLLWLLITNLVFYAWWAPVFVLILLPSIAVNWLAGSMILGLSQRGNRRLARKLLVSAVCANLALLGWFKYAGFFFGVNRGAALPLGISFFTFQQISYLVDGYRRDRPSMGPTAYAAFVSFFPHLIAGPIVRAREIVPQMTRPHLARWNPDNIAAGATIFLLGLAKKLVLADTFAQFSDVGFAAAGHGAALSFFEAWYAVLAYSLQIYFDFSGYSDMAIGLARMMNVAFPLNFDSPYQSASIAEFWRRWHITLGAFLRDYVYIPLGGNRRGEIRRLVNLMVTMLLGGLWHGAGWTFVLWGGLHGAFLVVHALWTATGRRLPRLAGQAVTLLVVIVAWVPFRAANMDACRAMLRGMAGINGIALPRMVIGWLPPLRALASPAGSLPYLGDGRTLSFPEVTACLLLGWFTVLALPNLHRWTEQRRSWGVAAGFAFSVQAMFFAPNVTPFLYFQF